jgi:hypothetical protein
MVFIEKIDFMIFTIDGVFCKLDDVIDELDLVLLPGMFLMFI